MIVAGGVEEQYYRHDDVERFIRMQEWSGEYFRLSE